MTSGAIGMIGRPSADVGKASTEPVAVAEAAPDSPFPSNPSSSSGYSPAHAACPTACAGAVHGPHALGVGEGVGTAKMTGKAGRRSSVATAIDQSRRTIHRIWKHPSNQGRRLRRVVFAAWFQLWTRVTRRPLRITVGDHSQMYAHLHFSATSEVVYANPPSIEQLVWARHLRPGDLFVDVGSSVGVYTIMAIEQGAEVIAFEPNEDAARLFRENMALNGYTPEFHEAAVSDRAGTMTMTFDLDVANHLLFEPDDRSSDVRSVPTVTLDEVVGDRQVAGLKLDTEGSERIVLAGAARALTNRQFELIQLEWNYASMKVLGETREPLARVLIDAGYTLMRPNRLGELVRPVESYDYGRDVFAILQ
jgi:FkbM family methyltransferase